jgi:hypothetical protein
MLTWVPEFSLVISRVVPNGTAILERTIVAQEVLDLLTEAAMVKGASCPLDKIWSWCRLWGSGWGSSYASEVKSGGNGEMN